MKFTLVALSTLRLFFLFLFFFGLLAGAHLVYCGPVVADDLFPAYTGIEKNVKFWEKIYATYSLNDAVIHDSKDLSKIYEVIALLDSDLPGATRLNEQAVKQAKKKYSNLLKKLSLQKPSTVKEIRVASLFSGSDTKKQMAAAASRIRSQTGLKERFLQGVVRSGEYLVEMKRIFRSYRLPEELVYLPHVESSFNTRAYSKFGAAGIWQFTRTTGKEYLKINYILDERLDPISATHAAAKYLKNSHRSLGDWPLAITSYNYGLAGMKRAVKEKKNYVNIFKNYRKGYFKFASRNFYAEFLAAVKVAQKLEKSTKFRTKPANNCRYFNLPGYIFLEDISRHFSLNLDTLIKLNPALRKPVLSGEKLIPKGYSLRLPAKKSTSRLIAVIPTSYFQKKQKKSQFHRVQRGETASAIANQYGISLKKLMKANNLDKFATIYIKQKLRIPGKHSLASSTTTNVLQITARHKDKVNPTENNLSIPTLSTTKKRRPSANESEFIPQKDPTVYNVFSLKTVKGKTVGYITVQPEESIGLYAEWLNSSITSIIALNSLNSDEMVGPGQQIKLPFDHQEPNLFEEKRLDYLQETEEDFFSAYTVVGQKVYQVNSGDTFWDLCYNKFDIPLWLLERYNSTINLKKLNLKQKLIIPLVQQI